MASDQSQSNPEPRKRPRKGARIRRTRLEDIPAIIECQRASYPGFPPNMLCDERQFRLQLETFPEGQMVAEVGGKIVGYTCTLIVVLDEDSPWYSYGEITGNGTFSTHDPSGDTLYGADIAVHPDYRRQGISGMLYEARKRILRRFNLRRMVAGGRIPGYWRFAGKLTAEEYVDKVVRGELEDPALNAHLKAGYAVRGVHMGYLRDEHSLDYATFLELLNPEHRPTRRNIAAAPMKRPVRKVRVCAAQYQMRRVNAWEDFEHQVSFFVDTAEQYNCHFLLFPELFTVQLFSLLDPDMKPVDAIEELAGMTDRYTEMFVKMAKRSGLHIIGGSHPVRTSDGIQNVAHLFSPSGNVYRRRSCTSPRTSGRNTGSGRATACGSSTPDTRGSPSWSATTWSSRSWSRLLTLAGAEIVFVPFSTDERKAYLRVRYTRTGAGGGELHLRGDGRQRGQPAAGGQLPDQLRTGCHLHARATSRSPRMPSRRRRIRTARRW